MLKKVSLLMDTAICYPAKNCRDLLFKLAFWRWRYAGAGSSLDGMSKDDAIVYSVFRDLVDHVGETAVLTPLDKETDLLRNPADE